MEALVGCYAGDNRPCRGCPGWYPDVGMEAVERMADIYILNPDGKLVKRDRGTEFSLCGPIESQVMEVIRREEIAKQSRSKLHVWREAKRQNSKRI